MKKLMMKTAVIAVLGLVVLSASASAQTPTMKVAVPFAFLAGDQTYTAGEYKVRLDTALGILDLQPVADSRSERVFVTAGAAARAKVEPGSGVLLFQRYGNAYALRSVYLCGAKEGYDLKISKAEVEMAKATGGSTGATEIGAMIH